MSFSPPTPWRRAFNPHSDLWPFYSFLYVGRGSKPLWLYYSWNSVYVWLQLDNQGNTYLTLRRSSEVDCFNNIKALLMRRPHSVIHLNINLIICYCLINFSGKSHANLSSTFRVILLNKDKETDKCQSKSSSSSLPGRSTFFHKLQHTHLNSVWFRF